MGKNRIPIKRIGCCILSVLLSISGCARESEIAEEVTLLEPVSVAAGSVAVERRDIYAYKIYSAICCPSVEECSTTTDFNFQSYAKVPGEEVSVGDVLIESDKADMEERIEAAKEGIAQLEESHREALSGLQENLSDAADDYTKQRIEEQIRENNELYELDHARAQALLNELYDARNKSGLVAPVSGTSVAMRLFNRGNGVASSFYRGEWIGKNTVVSAVGDLSQKELRSEYLSDSTLNAAEEVFALVNGERIEVSYQRLSDYEYQRQEEQNGTVYGCFQITSGEEKVEIGDYAVIVLITGAREDVLAIPADAIFYVGSDPYVYAMDGDAYREKQIRVGISDGYFTEVLSGLSEGDQVKSEYKIPDGTTETMVKYGDISAEFQATGFVFYATAVPVRNPITYGDVYLEELCVHVNEQVEEGAVLARVHVAVDTIEIERTKREITRLDEQISYLKRTDAQANRYRISTLEEERKKKQDYLNDLNADAAVTEIKAPGSGMITSVSDREEGELLSYKETLFSLADDQSCFILVEDGDGKLSYGNAVTVSYKDETGALSQAPGTVVTANAMCLSRDLKSGYALVQLPVETVAHIEGSTLDARGWWSLTRVNVSAKLRVMKHVLLLPKAAVHEHKGATYVNVVDENGRVREQAFVAGGSDASNYWVVRGLEEGMRICYE